MISLQELNPHNYPTTPEIDANLADLLVRINKIRLLWGKPMIVNSGLRTPEDQARINPSAPKSKHISGQAVDIADKSGELYDWCKANEKALETAGLYCEQRMGGWQHFQSVAPHSGHRWFFP